jgi:hypothetical protein
MSQETVNAEAHLLTLVDRPIPTFRGGTMTVLDVQARTVVVRTLRAPQGTAIRIAWVQRGIDRLLRDGETPPTAAALGRRSEFIGAVLLTIPGAVRSSDPPRIVLRRGSQSIRRPGSAIEPSFFPPQRPAVASIPPILARRLPSVTSARSAWPLVLLASAAAVAVTTYGWTSSPLRPLVTTWFLLICPGMALVRLLPNRGTLTRLVLAIATSLTLETLLAETMLEASAWSPRAALVVLIGITIVGSLIQLRTTIDGDTEPGMSGAHVVGSRRA